MTIKDSDVKVIREPHQNTRNIDRYIYMRVAFNNISRSWENVLIGYGFRR